MGCKSGSVVKAKSNLRPYDSLKNMGGGLSQPSRSNADKDDLKEVKEVKEDHERDIVGKKYHVKVTFDYETVLCLWVNLEFWLASK